MIEKYEDRLYHINRLATHKYYAPTHTHTHTPRVYIICVCGLVNEHRIYTLCEYGGMYNNGFSDIFFSCVDQSKHSAQIHDTMMSRAFARIQYRKCVGDLFNSVIANVTWTRLDSKKEINPNQFNSHIS